ncbi:Galactokinase [uncultured Ruminococcus sp.]|uniref:galactokinase n=1 Tax=Massiliimalia timonensis TaxID=1987501 RepID=UPI0008216224|nr:galactokinase family protein [Massiliimalia timonensis]MBS7175251.1 galactokinase [Clostridiales bacterium]SCI01373.1 Galactokinase [uncultured Clostridium sp.]SCI16973.1 Galactokinase [uncultured Ruminococcus sp.]
MEELKQLQSQLQNGGYDQAFRRLYPEKALSYQRQRYSEAIESFQEIFPCHTEAALYSAPGRTEVGGNHTDHQHGRVLAAAVNLDIIAVVARNDDNMIRLQSKGFPMNEVELSTLSPIEEEKGSSNSLIRGIAARFTQMGYPVGGLDIYTTSDVLKGSGLSSSAAFEVLVGTVISKEFCGGEVDAVEIAKIGKYAENDYFGKASGLMDQMVSSVGSFVEIDFRDPDQPVIEQVAFDFSASGFSLCITDTKGNHANLTPDYVAVPTEMKSVAAFFGKEVLREVEEKEFYARLPEIREQVSDRAVLRAIHFFQENERAKQEAEALKQQDFVSFCQIVKESGRSSYELLQNVFSPAHPEEQGVSIGLALSERALQGQGACRVHGGGFAGTIQAFVPNGMVEGYRSLMEQVFGEGACYVLQIREAGGVKLERE